MPQNILSLPLNLLNDFNNSSEGELNDGFNTPTIPIIIFYTLGTCLTLGLIKYLMKKLPPLCPKSPSNSQEEYPFYEILTESLGDIEYHEAKFEG